MTTPPPPPSPAPSSEPPAKRRRQRYAMSPTEWTVARERFRIAPDEVPPAAPNTAPPMAQLMEEALRSFHLPTVEMVTELAPHWAEIVGPELAAHTRPARVQNGTLYVSVAHPVFLARFHGGTSRRILDYVQTLHPELKINAVRSFIGS